jgi:hypothetical protein
MRILAENIAKGRDQVPTYAATECAHLKRCTPSADAVRPASVA